MLNEPLRNLMVSISVVAKLRLWKCQLVMGKNLQVEMKPPGFILLIIPFWDRQPNHETAPLPCLS